MFKDLRADELSWFANEFMIDFAKTSIAIENFSNKTYPRFYRGFFDVFKAFLEERTDFDAQGTLKEAYSDFHNTIKDFIPEEAKEGVAASLKNIPASGTMCTEQLIKLRKLEES